MELNTELNWPQAPSWSLFAGELGRSLILAGLAFFILSIVSWFLASQKPAFERIGKVSFTLGAVSVIGSIFCLGSLFVNEQFQYNLVRESIENGLALKYKVAAIWSHQEGSFLLWGVTSSIFGLLAVRGTGLYRRWFTIAYSTFLACLCGILAYETPFAITLTQGKALIPPNGAGLTPSLQNYWVVIHPPTIFTGFGSLTVMFCFAVAAMLSKNLVDWVKMVRPWALLSLAILGLGLAMGGFWAYETLGWGGFWAWDPVENVSFVPWVMTATFIHGLIVQSAKKRWVTTNLLLGGLPFLAFVYGTFLTRSGLYADVSVHSFAQMDKSALKILLGFLVFSVTGFTALWLIAGRSITPADSTENGANREGLYRSGMLMLGGIGVATAIGMSVPLIMYLLGRQSKVVEEKLYHQVLVWPFVPLLIFIAIAPFASWRAMPWKALFARIANVASLAFMFTGISLFIIRNPVFGIHAQGNETIAFPFGLQVSGLAWVLTLLFLCFFTATANIWRLSESLKRTPMSVGGFVAHLGVAVLMAGMILSRGFEQKETVFVQRGAPARALDYTITYDSYPITDLTDRSNKVLFKVSHINQDGTESNFMARPGLFYTTDAKGEPNAMVWPHIEHQFSHDIYFTLHPPELNLWKDPVSIKPGESLEENQVTVTYEKMTMEGKPGQPGTKFGAQLKIKTQRGTFRVTPTMEMTANGLIPELTRIDQDLMVTVQGMDAGTHSALVQVHYANPVYPIDLFYKPMPILVWIGTGILTLGGLLSAWYRRRPKNGPPATEDAQLSADPKENAVASVAQV